MTTRKFTDEQIRQHFAGMDPNDQARQVARWLERNLSRFIDELDVEPIAVTLALTSVGVARMIEGAGAHEAGAWLVSLGTVLQQIDTAGSA